MRAHVRQCVLRFDESNGSSAGVHLISEWNCAMSKLHCQISCCKPFSLEKAPWAVRIGTEHTDGHHFGLRSCILLEM